MQKHGCSRQRVVNPQLTKLSLTHRASGADRMALMLALSDASGANPGGPPQCLNALNWWNGYSLMWKWNFLERYSHAALAF